MEKKTHKQGIYEKYIKRPQDFLCALTASIVLSPVMLVTAVLVRTKSGSPVIFTQERPGKDEKIFKLYKFRTMTDARDENTMCKQVRSDCEALYISKPGKTCPTESLETLAKYNAEGRPIWKPMHAQPLYRLHGFVTREEDGRAKTNACIKGSALGKDGMPFDIGMDIFRRGLCLPSDIAMTPGQQEIVIEIIKHCFD